MRKLLEAGCLVPFATVKLKLMESVAPLLVINSKELGATLSTLNQHTITVSLQLKFVLKVQNKTQQTKTQLTVLIIHHHY